MDPEQGTAGTAPVYEIDKLRLTDAAINRADRTIQFHLTGTDRHIGPLQAALQEQFGENGQVKLTIEIPAGRRESDRDFTLLYRAPDRAGVDGELMQDAPKVQKALEGADMARGAPDMIDTVFKALNGNTALGREFGRRGAGSGKERQ